MRKLVAWLVCGLAVTLLVTAASAPTWAMADPTTPPAELVEPAPQPEPDLTPTPDDESTPTPAPDPTPTPSPSPSPEPSRTFRSVPKPKLSGTAKVGRTLTAKPGSAKPAAGSWSFRWYRGSDLIPEATGRTYTLTAADRGKRITVRSVAEREGYRPRVSAASKRTKKVAAGSLKTSKPTISGVKQAGDVLTADAGTWTSGATLSYQWFRAGRTIDDADSADYTLTPADEGLTIGVKVTGRLAGYTTRTTSSKTVRIPLPGGCQGAADTRASTQQPFVVCGIVVVSKRYRINSGYRPPLVSVGLRRSGISSVELEPESATALRQLFDAAQRAGHTLTVRSAYRSYATQNRMYSPGMKLTAPPGASEHQTGLAVDLAAIRGSSLIRGFAFGTSAAGRWVHANAARYGFIVRYPRGKQSSTGIPYEPWHLRYIGTDHAVKVKASGLTLEQYLQIR